MYLLCLCLQYESEEQEQRMTDLKLNNEKERIDVGKTLERALLFISYKFVKGYLAITFLLLAFSNSNYVCQCFLYNQEQNFSWIRQKMRNLAIHPHYK